MARKRHQLIGLGGTFDHFHKGHEYFIDYASKLSEKLVIGITDQKLSQSKQYPELIQTFRHRLLDVKHFCEKNGINAELVQLTDPYGPTIDRETRIQALCVTEETVAGGEKINQIREASHARPLQLYVAKMIVDEQGRELHSDRIRGGEVNREGVVYLSHFTQDLRLTDEQKQLLRKPLGQIVDKPTENWRTVQNLVVGDSTLERFISYKWQFDLAVYDKQQQRETVVSPEIGQLQPDLTTGNQAGSISLRLVKDLQTALKKRLKYLLVTGEEDLATAALILMTPLETRIYYGQPHQGMVEVIVTEPLKEKIFRILFNPS